MKINIKNLNLLDIGLIKWSVFFSTLFIISIWPSFTNLVIRIHWVWFLSIGLILGIKPLTKVFK